jgi:ABC-2 type transport system permease protein
MNWNHIISHEWQTRLSQPAVLLSHALFLMCLVYAVANGRAAVERRLDAIALHEVEASEARQRWLSDLRTLEERGQAAEVPAWSGSAMDVTFPSYLPVSPLADFARGQSDLLPCLGTISLWDPDVRLFSRYEFADPVSLGMGGFDLSRAIVLVLPLVLIAVCFDVLSADRDANRLSLLLAQGARIREMFWRRLVLRAGEILALTLLVSLVAALWPSDAASLAQRLPFFAMWTVAFLLYATFWIAIIAVVASGNRTGQVNIVVLLLTWAVLTLIAPASMTSISEALYPTPSRAAYVSEARRIEIDTELAEADISKRAILDHPEMLNGLASSIPDYVRTAFLVTTAVDDATKSVLANFEDAAERREATLGWVGALSPAAIVQGLFSDIAGTSSARHRSYMSQARALKAEYAEQVGPQIVAGRRLSVQQAKSLPVFQFQEESLSQLVRASARRLVFLGFVVCLLLIVADWRISRAARAV